MQISIWEQESFFARRDIIIVGGGISGLWCAYELLQKNPFLSLLIIDRGIIPSGASTRNAGFACFGSPTELLSDAKKMGEERMWELTEMRFRGIQKIRRILGDSVVDYDACGGYECLQHNDTDISKLTENLVWLNKGLKGITGCNETFIRADEKLTTFAFQGFDSLIENKLEGGLHSGKLVMALREKIQSRGGRVMQGITITRWEENSSGVTVCANGNIQIQASKLFLCTNALSADLLPGINLSPARGQIIVTSPINNLPVKGTFHFDEGFYYFRNVGNRVLLGGARNKAFDDENTTVFATTETIQNALEKFLSRHILPKQSFTIDYRWSGIMGFTDNKQPLIKPLSERVTAFIICNGMGVAISPIMAEQIEI